jgi:hypothetical protein
MRIITIFFIITFLCFISFDNIYSQDQNNPLRTTGLRLIVTTDKTDYLEGEKIWKEIKLIVDKKLKLDEHPFLVSGRDLREFVVNSENKEIPYAPPFFDIFGNPKEYPDTMYVFGTLDIGIYEHAPKSMYLSSIYLPADVYKYYAQAYVVINKKTYIVESESIQFTVHKPEGDDASVRQIYFDLIPLVVTDSSYRDYDLISSMVDSCFQYYMNSVYINRIFELTRPYYFQVKKFTTDECIELYKKLTIRYPYYQNFRELLGLYFLKHDPDGFIAFVNSVEMENRDYSSLKTVLFHIKRFFEMMLRGYKPD